MINLDSHIQINFTKHTADKTKELKEVLFYKPRISC